MRPLPASKAGGGFHLNAAKRFCDTDVLMSTRVPLVLQPCAAS
jgi:hypothetical protein